MGSVKLWSGYVRREEDVGREIRQIDVGVQGQMGMAGGDVW